MPNAPYSTTELDQRREQEAKVTIDAHLITEKQRKRLFAIAKQSGVDTAAVGDLLVEWNYSSTKDIPEDSITKR